MTNHYKHYKSIIKKNPITSNIFHFLKIITCSCLLQCSYFQCGAQLAKRVVLSQSLITDKNGHNLFESFQTDSSFYPNGNIENVTDYKLIKNSRGKLLDSIATRLKIWDENGGFVGFYDRKKNKINDFAYSCGCNLVENGDFENHSVKGFELKGDTIVYKYTSIDYQNVEGWSTIKTLHTPIYDKSQYENRKFNSHRLDSISAVSGTSFSCVSLAYYAVFPTRAFDLDTFLQNKLKLPAIKGQKYLLTLWIRKNPYCMFNYGALSIYLAKDYFSDKGKKSDLQEIYNKPYNDLNNSGWQKIVLSFKAKKTSNYLVIGNFNPSIKLNVNSLSKDDQDAINYQKNYRLKSSNNVLKEYVIVDGKPDVHYIDTIITFSNNYRFRSRIFVDNVCLSPVKCIPIKDILKTTIASIVPGEKKQIISNDSLKSLYKPNEIETERSYILNNVSFEFNSFSLSSPSFNELDMLYNILSENKQYTIDISGHTDNSGTEKYNINLSAERAKSVANYLINKGIKSNRIKYTGFGSSLPIADNSTEDGRAKNRRVEFKLINNISK